MPSEYSYPTFREYFRMIIMIPHSLHASSPTRTHVKIDLSTRVVVNRQVSGHDAKSLLECRYSSIIPVRKKCEQCERCARDLEKIIREQFGELSKIIPGYISRSSDNARRRELGYLAH